MTMHIEHEEAMRADFHDRFAETLKTLLPNISDAQRAQCAARIAEYEQRWHAGPYAQEWEFLHAAYADFRDHPQEMARFAADLDANRELWKGNGLTDVMRRSVDQARTIAAEERSALAVLREQQPIRRER
ncbi:hypothetical protein H0264_18585 [Nocardia huaxiensis]|uniref:Uncharacterized protein n=1 Tax=Nocardia huaxiensis TaxID=2755382 RepID=A0A7D6ZF30_9NOCA|nr:hypothetical protein [Nocardia huaxiensis]QLY33968.1 hypothetical protein H0264_18585 [Nocardia huaxiensis]